MIETLPFNTPSTYTRHLTAIEYTRYVVPYTRCDRGYTNRRGVTVMTLKHIQPQLARISDDETLASARTRLLKRFTADNRDMFYPELWRNLALII